jgi:hypothetical protein
MSAPAATGGFGVTVSLPSLAMNPAGSLFTETDETPSSKCRSNCDTVRVAVARTVVTPDSISDSGW